MPLSQPKPPVAVIDGEAEPDVAPNGVAVPAGWTRREGFALPDKPWDLSEHRWVCTGVVGDDEEAVVALSALARGVGLVIALKGSSRFRLQVLDDLHHNGEVTMALERRGPVVDLDPDDVALLRALADGATVDEAARQTIISPRTAHRRLAAVRAAYQATNTTEVVARWLADGSPGA